MMYPNRVICAHALSQNFFDEEAVALFRKTSKYTQKNKFLSGIQTYRGLVKYFDLYAPVTHAQRRTFEELMCCQIEIAQQRVQHTLLAEYLKMMHAVVAHDPCSSNDQLRKLANKKEEKLLACLAEEGTAQEIKDFLRICMILSDPYFVYTDDMKSHLEILCVAFH